jgi:hypothetical protein
LEHGETVAEIHKDGGCPLQSQAFCWWLKGRAKRANKL